MWRSTLISKKYPPKFVYLMLKVTRRHIYTLRDSLDPLVKAATLLRLFSLPNGVFHLQFSNKKHYNLILTTHLRYKKKIIQLPAFTFNHNYFPLFTLIYGHISLSTFLSSTFLCFHLPLSTSISVHWPSSTFIFLHLTYSIFIYLHQHLPSSKSTFVPSFTFIAQHLP